MALLKDLKNFSGVGMNSDDAVPSVGPQDTLENFNMRFSGTSDGEDGYGTNIPSNRLVSGTLQSGINKRIGGAEFQTLRIGIGFIYNSAGYHQIIETNADTFVETVVFTNLTDSAGIDVLPLDPKYYVTDIKIVGDTFLLFRADNLAPGYINYTRLKSGFYGVLTANDFMLIKPQNLIPTTFVYNNDASRSVNLLTGKLFQFITQFGFVDYEKSAWSTISKRSYPSSQSTPTVGTNVTIDNNLIVSVNIGDNRVDELNIGARYASLDFFLIKNIKRADILALPNVTVDVGNQIYEAYDPATNIYSFVFYNDGLYQNVSVLDTDLYFDSVPLKAGAMENTNGNIVTLGDYLNGYDRPDISVNIQPIAYDPQIAVTPPTNVDKLRVTYVDGGSSGSGAGNHKRTMQVNFLGLPKAGDVINFIFTDIRDASQYFNVAHTVVSGGEENNLLQTMLDFAGEISASFNTRDLSAGANASSDMPNTPQVIIRMIGPPYYGLTSATVVLNNTGVGVSRSISSLKLNSAYQAALSFYDDKGRFLPLDTDNKFIFKTQSYAQTGGLPMALQWAINSPPPANAVSAQWLLTENNTHQSDLYIDGVLIKFISGWDSFNNTPALAAGTGSVGDTYVVGAVGKEQNLGNGPQNFNSGDFIVYNGVSWDVVSKDFGDLSATKDYMVFKINPLQVFNKTNSSSILAYEYVPGDRVTFGYYLNGGAKAFFNNPLVDVEIVNFDPTTYLLKVRQSSDITGSTRLYNGVSLQSKDVIFELYTPKKRVATTDGVTINNAQVFYEIGERIPIVNGVFAQTTGTIYDGDVYYKTREVVAATDPSILLELLVEDFNFSDFYISNFNSYGRARTYDDILETNTKIACLCYSDEYIIGSKINGLTRFFPSRVYGEADGQLSANYGAIDKILQRNNEMVVCQQLKISYVPVFESIIVDQAEQQQVAISDKLFGNVRYSTNGNKGTGGWKRPIVLWDNNVYFLDPNRSEPCRAGLDGVKAISGKMSKYFKNTLQQAYKNGLEPIAFYDHYNNEYVVSIPTVNGIVATFNFNIGSWQYLESYPTPLPNGVTLVAPPAHGTVSYDSTTGLSTYTPTTGYVGTDNFTFSFIVGGATITKRTCINVSAGTTTVYPFSFAPKTNQPLNTVVMSNPVLIQGNNIPVAVSITGGLYSINGGAFTSAPGFANANDTIIVEVTTSATNNTATSCTLTVSTTSATFTATTVAMGSNALLTGTAVISGTSDSFDVTLNIDHALVNDLLVEFYVFYRQGSTFIRTTPNGFGTIMAGNGSVVVSSYGGFISSHGTPTLITVFIVNATPNPNGIYNVIY